MGVTGSGKSSLISHLTNEEIKIGQSLNSETHMVQPYAFRTPSGAKGYLIDTPGFDDTDIDDAKVLNGIAKWLARIYGQGRLLQGILYLHKITDNRMTGTAMNNLRMLRKLCGRDALRNVLLVTTMWEGVDIMVGNTRENELQSTPKYWGDMIDKHGSKAVRHLNNRQSALRLLELLLPNHEETLTIQEEMADGRMIIDTTAGQNLKAHLERRATRAERKIVKLSQELEEARAERDPEAQSEIKAEQEQRQREIEQLRQQQDEMRVSHKAMYDELVKAREKDKKRYEEKIQSLECQLVRASARSPEPSRAPPAPRRRRSTYFDDSRTDFDDDTDSEFDSEFDSDSDYDDTDDDYDYVSRRSRSSSSRMRPGEYYYSSYTRYRPHSRHQHHRSHYHSHTRHTHHAPGCRHYREQY
ncbi:hypothetical protein CPLU01_10543 [Colletotrichum plurivorum]|uniref:G domain-containing protein n=1 Tax=Colletotrichum plurivorum TaxID=2175906 RepID=A0A8H6K5V0_9PEZI|nr:hypothetical protein CPLU01_10543 [Colletotrichum plurivorum]